EAAERAVEPLGLLVTVHHQYTHHRREVECWLCSTADSTKRENEKWVTLKEMEQYAFPAGARKVLEHIKAV
ncbi:MAG: hypothetical protein CSA51_03855, partial [Gammaproteobacteria bacterium]